VVSEREEDVMSRRSIATLLMLGVGLMLHGPASATPLTPRQIYKQYGKAVVLVFGTDGSAQGSAGTGSVISKDGQVITNAHVVMKDGRPFKKVFIYLKPDKLTGSMKDDLAHRFKATVIEMDEKLDLALLRMVDPPSDLATLDFVDPDAVEIGEPVVAIGHPETGGLWTLTTGSISSVVADFQGIEGKDVFQTEASVNRGNSGGPLINAYGQMVGINTCISRRAADGLAITDINFSLKSSVAVEWLNRRRLMEVAYVKPPDENTATVVATADPPPAKAQPETKPKEKYTVDGGDGKTLVAVVEPEGKEEVADDPEFQSAAQADEKVSATGKVPTKAKPAAKPEKVRPKHLTKARPYKLDPFVAARVREIKELEKMMEDMSSEIEKKTGKKKQTKSDGMGLW
jgi:serine protease Do